MTPQANDTVFTLNEALYVYTDYLAAKGLSILNR